jgi:hypothetical protein
VTEAPNYVVICATDTCTTDGEGFEMTQATRRLFTKSQAEAYAATLAKGRYPRVITAAEYLHSRHWRIQES